MLDFFNYISIDYVLRPQEVAKSKNAGKPSEKDSKEIIWKHVFFRPYNKKEFNESLSQMFMPGAMLILGVIFPQLLATLAILLLVTCATYAILYGINKLIDNQKVSVFLTTLLDHIQGSFQGIVDMLILPFSLTVMLTRGIATAVEKVSGYDIENSGWSYI